MNFTIHDQHLHSSFSFDSEEDMENYVKEAVKNNNCYFITTEHYELNSFKGNITIDFKALKKRLEEIALKYPITPLLGIEIGYKPEITALIEAVTRSHDFDLVLLSIHSDKNGSFFQPAQYKRLGVKQVLNNYFELMLAAINDYSNFDCLAHFDYAFRNAYLDSEFNYNDYLEQIKAVFKALIRNNKALEINLKVQSEINDEMYLKTILKLYFDLGGRKIIISSDSHNLESYKKRFLTDYPKYLKLFKEIGFEALTYYVKREAHKFSL
ncbi:MAG: PHP domain-containing protein [Erysipelotrichales bacterium]|nr:PHP domain-containing protein [Erysipelotrichales bacterium]